MSSLLKNTKDWHKVLIDIEQEIKDNTEEFNDIKIDFLAISLYANFERDLSNIINEHLLNGEINNCVQNYINYIKAGNKVLHRGSSKDDINKLLKKVFNKSLENLLPDEKERIIYSDFIEFRHSIAHWKSEQDYNSKKQKLLSNITNSEHLLQIIDKLLTEIKNIKNIEKITTSL